MPVAIFASLTACSNADPDWQQQKQAVTFNERQVDQPRGELLRADDSIDYFHTQQRAYFRAHAANATGTTFANPCQTVDDEMGSAVLSGADRAVTAFHNLRNDSTIRVVFGGKSDASGTVVEDATTSGISYSDDDAYRLDVEEENALLANRLWSLHLLNWAHETNGENTREELRNWWFEPATGSVSGTWSGQGFLEYDVGTNAFAGRDIAVLEAQVLDTSGWFPSDPQDPIHIPTGAFTIDKPGVFFDSVEFQPFEPLQVTGDRPLAAVHTTRWPDNTDPNDNYPLASREGFYMQTLATIDVASCASELDEFQQNVLTTVDMVSGSSGGALLIEDEEEFLPDGAGDNVIRRMFATGVFAWHVYSSGMGSGPDMWEDHATIGEPNPSFSGEANSFTAIVDTDDLDFIGGDPGPVFHPNDKKACSGGENKPDCIHCSSFTAQGGCEDFVDAPAVQVGEGQNPGFTYRDLDPDDDESRKPGNKSRAIKCWFDEDGAPWTTGAGPKQPGVIVGFVGGMVNWDADPSSSEIAVGTLFAICAPLSSVAYTENWQLLTLKGGRVKYEDDNIAGRLGWKPLYHSVQYAYELRRDHVGQNSYDHVRPVSMKLCPPNTVVNGATFKAYGTGTYGPEHTIALRNLNCKTLPNNVEHEWSGNVELSGNVSQGLQGYTLGGDPFLLDQKIGNPSTTTGYTITQACAGTGTEYAHGMETTHDANGRLVQVYLDCGAAP